MRGPVYSSFDVKRGAAVKSAMNPRQYRHWHRNETLRRTQRSSSSRKVNTVASPLPCQQEALRPHSRSPSRESSCRSACHPRATLLHHGHDTLESDTHAYKLDNSSAYTDAAQVASGFSRFECISNSHTIPRQPAQAQKARLLERYAPVPD